MNARRPGAAGSIPNRYLEPAGLLRGRAAGAARAAGTALPLAGGPIWFTACLLISRKGRGRETRWLPVPALRARAAGDPGLEARLRRLTAPRPAFAGVDMHGPSIVGVINVTPDSFSDGGRHAAPEAAAAHGAALAAAGAALLDVGGESTRPGAAPVPGDVERGRVLPAVSALAAAGYTVSVDTRNAGTMRAAAAAGAAVLNDVTALTHDPGSLAAAADTGCAVVLMHSGGDPRVMQDDPRYDDVALDVYDYLDERAAACRAAGIAPGRLAVDPGFGFGKTPAHNMRLIESMALFHGLGCPLLIGASRKSTIAHIAGESARAADSRLAGSLALAQAAWARGVQMVRVHDAAETAQARALWQALDDSHARRVGSVS